MWLDPSEKRLDASDVIFVLKLRKKVIITQYTVYSPVF